MSIRVVRLPDVGEGVAEAELVSWHVAVGDIVTPDTTVAEVLTDKATVEIYSPVNGRVVSLHGTAGDVLAIGSDFIAIETNAASTETLAPAPLLDPIVNPAESAPTESTLLRQLAPSLSPAPLQPVLAAPAVRERARAIGVDLHDVRGSGPDGRITHGDLDRRLSSALRPPQAETTEIPLIGLRRKIAAQMTTSSSQIPHITYVEELDMTAAEHLRRALATEYPGQQRLTVLPFVMSAVVRALMDHPQVNATFNNETQLLTTHAAVHIGIATQTVNGLVVPVVSNAERLDLWALAAELDRVSSAARNGTAERSELSGSTITITSLGALGGLVTTPIINHPEVAIVGINKLQTRPVWNGSSFVPRTMMNLSSSFDHRIVDGWQAAMFVQRIKALLEEPSMLFVPLPPLS